MIFTNILGVSLPEEQHTNQSSGGSIRNKTRQYLEQLTPDTRLKLYEVYRHDFLMFDYKP